MQESAPKQKSPKRPEQARDPRNQTCQHTDQSNKTATTQRHTRKNSTNQAKSVNPKRKTRMYTPHETTQTDKTAKLRKLTTRFRRTGKRLAKESNGENLANSQDQG